MRVGVLASGRGTNLQALIEAARAPGFPAEIVLVGCNRPGAGAITRAEDAGIPVALATRADFPKRTDRQGALLTALQQANVDLVVLAGFDEILLPPLLRAYAGRVLNTHPSLLPAFGGTMHAVRDALEHGARVTGCTVHLVTDELDAGPVLFQHAVEVRDDDDEASLHERILEWEHRLLPEAVRAMAEGRVRVEGRRARVIASADYR